LKRKSRDKVKIVEPKPFGAVGGKFKIRGWIPKSWLHLGTYTGLGYCLIDKNCVEFSCANIHIRRKWWYIFRKNIPFEEVIEFNFCNKHFILKSKGRIVVALDGQNGKEHQVFYLPITIRGKDVPADDSREAIEEHAAVGEKIEKYRADLRIYYSELKKIHKRKSVKDTIFSEKKLNEFNYTHNWDIAGFFLKTLEDSEESFENYLYSEEDRDENQLNEKYKEVLEWRGPLLHGTAAKLDGFEFRIYSNDHDKHFHVIHRGKGINARFSFPTITLQSYTNSHRNTIGSKEIKKIQDFFKKPENLAKLEKEFNKRA
jgi:hypothetical protein